MLARRWRGLMIARLESASVVGHREDDAIGLERQCDPDIRRASVPDRVVHRFLCNAQQLPVGVGRTRPWTSDDRKLRVHTLRSGGVLGELPQRMNEGARFHRVVTKLEDRFARLAQTVTDLAAQS